MKNTLTKEQADTILKVLDDAIKTGPWEKSNFLRHIGKDLLKIRDNFSKQLMLPPKTVKTQLELAREDGLHVRQQKIFIALYSTEGSHIQSWERILANLPSQMISRPIYTDEANVKTLIQSKTNKVNEAYVVVYIDESAVLVTPPDKISKDKLGKPLIFIKDKTIYLDKIDRFVHSSGTYHYLKGRLVYQCPN